MELRVSANGYPGWISSVVSIVISDSNRLKENDLDEMSIFRQIQTVFLVVSFALSLAEIASSKCKKFRVFQSSAVHGRHQCYTRGSVMEWCPWFGHRTGRDGEQYVTSDVLPARGRTKYQVPSTSKIKIKPLTVFIIFANNQTFRKEWNSFEIAVTVLKINASV